MQGVCVLIDVWIWSTHFSCRWTWAFHSCPAWQCPTTHLTLRSGGSTRETPVCWTESQSCWNKWLEHSPIKINNELLSVCFRNASRTISIFNLYPVRRNQCSSCVTFESGFTNSIYINQSNKNNTEHPK